WADRALVDAPCTGLGTLARRPDLRWRKRPEDVAQLAALQREILAGVAPVVRPGGVLVYSTCTTEPEENQEVGRAFLAAAPDYRLEPVTPWVPGALRAAVDAAGGPPERVASHVGHRSTLAPPTTVRDIVRRLWGAG